MQRPRHLALMLALTFSTGVVDAVGFLGLERVFTGNMTGNVVILGMAVAGADDLPVLGPVVALLGFLVGAAVAGRVLRRAPAGWSRAATCVLGVVALTLLLLGLALLLQPAPEGIAQQIITGLLAGAMGVQAGTARHIAVKDVTTVVVTSAITALAADSRFGTGAGAQPGRRGGAVLAIGVGAAVGAGLLQWTPGAGLFVCAAVTGAVAAAGQRDLARASA